MLAFDCGLEITGRIDRADVRAVVDTPGPASAEGDTHFGATNFALPEWWGFDTFVVRIPTQHPRGENDGNAAALYYDTSASSPCGAPPSARFRGQASAEVIESAYVVRGAAGMAGELGHVHIPMHGLLGEGQPVPRATAASSETSRAWRRSPASATTYCPTG